MASSMSTPRRAPRRAALAMAWSKGSSCCIFGKRLRNSTADRQEMHPWVISRTVIASVAESQERNFVGSKELIAITSLSALPEASRPRLSSPFNSSVLWTSGRGLRAGEARRSPGVPSDLSRRRLGRHDDVALRALEDGDDLGLLLGRYLEAVHAVVEDLDQRLPLHLGDLEMLVGFLR